MGGKSGGLSLVRSARGAQQADGVDGEWMEGVVEGDSFPRAGPRLVSPRSDHRRSPRSRAVSGRGLPKRLSRLFPQRDRQFAGTEPTAAGGENSRRPGCSCDQPPIGRCAVSIATSANFCDSLLNVAIPGREILEAREATRSVLQMPEDLLTQERLATD